MLHKTARSTLIQRNHDAVVGTANRQQVIFRVFQIALERGQAGFQIFNLGQLFASLAGVFGLDAVQIERDLLQGSLRHAQILFRSGHIELQLDEFDFRFATLPG